FLLCCQRSRRMSRLFPYTTLFRSKMLLPQGVERNEHAPALDMPEGPAVARGRLLQRGADLVDRAAVALAGYRAVGADRRRPAPLDRKSTRLNSTHQINSDAVFCLK